MFKNQFGIILATLVLMNVFITSAWAGCTQANAAGHWNVYVDGKDGWAFCPMNINAAGVIAAGSRCTDSNGAYRTVLAGSKITVKPSCVASARVALSGGLVTIFSHMTFTRNKFQFSGLGSDNLGGTFTYTGIKL